MGRNSLWVSEMTFDSGTFNGRCEMRRRIKMSLLLKKNHKKLSVYAQFCEFRVTFNSRVQQLRHLLQPHITTLVVFAVALELSAKWCIRTSAVAEPVLTVLVWLHPFFIGLSHGSRLT